MEQDESFIDRLKKLSENRIFVVVAIVFFAFLTALIFAIIAYQQNSQVSSETIRNSVQQRAGTYQNQPSSSSQAAQNPIKRILNAIFGSSEQNASDVTDSNNPSRIGSVKDTIDSTKTEVQKNSEDALKNAIPRPKIQIGTYVLQTEMPQEPSRPTMYTLKSSYTNQDVETLAYSLGFQKFDLKEVLDNTIKLYDTTRKHYIGMDIQTGEFTFLSDTGIAPSNSSGTPMQVAKSFLAEVGLDHSTIQPYATYKRSDDTDGNYVYIELHSKLAFPTVNTFGILNLKETDNLASVTIGKNSQPLTEDPEIINTSDNTDGLARPDDFNTIVIKYNTDDGLIYGMSSSIPRILSETQVAQTEILSPIQAFEKYSKGMTQFGMSSPIGYGDVSLTDVYTNGLAQARSVDVVDFDVVYPVNPLKTQSALCPAYAFRSYGAIQSGFETQFVHIVSAVDNPLCQENILGATIAQTADSSIEDAASLIIRGESNSVQYGTVTFNDVSVDVPANECDREITHAKILEQTPNVTKYLAWNDQTAIIRASGDLSEPVTSRYWYLVAVSNTNNTSYYDPQNLELDRDSAIQVRNTLVGQCKMGSMARCKLPKEFSEGTIVACIFLTVGSPYIHFYPTSAMHIDTTLSSPGGVPFSNIQYTKTGQTGNWSFDVTADGTLQDPATGSTHDSLHWEYNAYNVRRAYLSYPHKPTQGFVVEKSQAELFVQEYSRRKGLNPDETETLRADVHRELSDVTSPFVLIQEIPEDFVNQTMPLQINPQPQTIHRIYLSLLPLEIKTSVERPQITPITRKGFTVVETGVITYGLR